MGRSIGRKLKNSNGASIIIAMIVLMLCFTVGSTMLAAASADRTTIRYNKIEQQAYLTSRSTVELLEKELSACSFVITKITASGNDPSYDYAAVSSETISGKINGVTAELQTASPDILENYMYQAALNQAYNGGSGVISEETFNDNSRGTLERDYTLEAEQGGLSNIRETDSTAGITFSMDQNYNVTARVTGDDGLYPILLQFTAKTDTALRTDRSHYSGEGEELYEIVTTTETTTVSWKNHTLSQE